MQNPLNQIVPSVFGESRLEDVPLDALHLLTVKYPFSAPAHLMYARRLKDMGDSRYGEAVSIAALHYANPHWLQHQLAAPLEAVEYAVATIPVSTELLAEAEAENREMAALPPADGETAYDSHETDNEAFPGESDSGTGTNPAVSDTPPSVMDTGISAPEPSTEEEDRSPEAPLTPSEFSLSPAPADSPLAVENGGDVVESLASPDIGSIAEDAVAADLVTGTDTGITTLYEGETTEASREVGDSELIHVTLPETVSGDVTDTPDGGEASEGIGVMAVADAPTEGDHPLPPEAVESVPAGAERPAVESEVAAAPIPEDPPLPVEPLHLSDYLASQGIVVSSELEPKGDGKGERSFTGWLRTMKRFQPDRSAPLLSEGEEEVIRAEAEASNQDEDIVTEAMAEIYARQGLTRKAIDIYSKLCLLDPDRTSTFADRITQLKAIST